MESYRDSIIVTDETIISYFRSNPNLNFITMTHILINILKEAKNSLGIQQIKDNLYEQENIQKKY
jgi:hypothetical protein